MASQNLWEPNGYLDPIESAACRHFTNIQVLDELVTKTPHLLACISPRHADHSFSDDMLTSLFRERPMTELALTACSIEFSALREER